MKWLLLGLFITASRIVASDCLLVAFRNNKAGYIDSNGVVKIPLQFDNARSFSEGLAAIKQEGKWGFIDEKGSIQISPKYVEISDFTFSFAIAKTGSNSIAIDFAGNELARFGSENTEPWNTNMVRVGGAPEVRLVKLTNGNLIGKSQVVDRLFEGVAVACRTNRFGFVSAAGEPIGPFQYDESFAFSGGFGAVKRSGKWGFVDKTGKETIPLQFEWVSEFSENLAPARKENKWGFIDKTGQWIITPQYEQVRMGFSENVAAVKRDGKWGYVDRNGKWVLKPTYVGAWPFVNGVAVVQTGRRCILDSEEWTALGSGNILGLR